MITNHKIAIAEDHPLFKEGLKNLINNEKGFRVVFTADNSDEIVDLVKKHKPDMLSLDIKMLCRRNFCRYHTGKS